MDLHRLQNILDKLEQEFNTEIQTISDNVSDIGLVSTEGPDEGK